MTQNVTRQVTSTHMIYRVLAVTVIGPYLLHLTFDDMTEQTIDFQLFLNGSLYRPLRDLAVFNQVRIDPEVHTIVWPNGADFDPATLHDWPGQITDLSEHMQRWEQPVLEVSA